MKVEFNDWQYFLERQKLLQKCQATMACVTRRLRRNSQVNREFEIHDAAIAKTSLKIPSLRLSIFFVIISVFVTLTFKS